MGLDMYLSRKIHLGTYSYDDKAKEENKICQEIFKALGIKKPEHYTDGTLSISLPEGYWRKANAIHAWFVRNVQDGVDNCESFYVSADSLSQLRELCKEVLADRSKAAELLPSQAGFFFGGTDYDEWYFENLEHTVKIIDHALDPENLVGKYDAFEYQSSW